MTTMRNISRATLWAALLALGPVSAVASCEASNKGEDLDDDGSGARGGAGGSGGQGGSGGLDLSGPGGSGGGPHDGELTLPTELKCAENDQSILIIDMRSGWWSGDGGDYHSVVLNEIFNTADPETNVPCGNISIEYHYFIQGFTRKCIYKPGQSPSCLDETLPDPLTFDQFMGYFETSFDDLTQVWILSGSQLDPADLEITATFFVQFVDMIADHCMPMLLAADDCFIDHGNIISQALGMGSVFQHMQAFCPQFVGVSAAEAPNITAQSTMLAGTHLSDHILFTDVANIADGVQNGFGVMGNPTGDSLVGASGVEVIATNTSNLPQIGEAFVEIPGEEYPRPILLDAGWDRSWAVAGHEGTHTYMRNLALYMGLIGCIAEEHIPE
jgi:hypothetical protein